MSKNDDGKQIDVTGLDKPVARKWTPEEQEEVQRAYDEFDALTLGKKEMTTKELYELKRYAKKRTDLSKDDTELTPEQFVWKIMHDSLDKVIGDNMDSEQKTKMDELIDQADSLEVLKDVVDQIVPLGQAIETELVMQQAGLTVYFDKGPENNYKLVVDGVTSDLVNPDKWTPEERIEKAEMVLKIIAANRDFLYQKQLVERHEVIHKKLREFDKIFSTIDSAILEDNDVKKDDDITDLFNRTREWLKLTKDLYASRTKAISAVKNGLDTDEFLPKHILEQEGDVSGNIKIENTSFVEQMTATVVLINQASEQEEEISKKRNPISEGIFGKQEEYIKFDGAEEAIQPALSAPQKNEGGMGMTTKWVIVIGLSIVALSWGIWTAIGVFVLGVIILNVMSK